MLIAIFGAISGGGGPSFDVAIDKGSDTTSLLYQIITANRIFDIHHGTDAQIDDDLRKGRITAVLKIHRDSTNEVQYVIDTKTSSASKLEFPQVQNVLTGIINSQSHSKNTFARLAPPTVVPGRRYKIFSYWIGSLRCSISFLYAARNTCIKKNVFHANQERIYCDW